ncbi:Glutathione S-transferase [Trichoplax sp. H2]|nr:Glutathione S-transferase [Trichoplax sp. H2]|eukprot:RDD47696.1 Glutathione S-transferase [Trichoplax sp. H2]
MPAITLHYFNLAARGETIRLIFAAGGVDYKDLRYEQENWPTLKASGKFPFDQLPVLEVDGRLIGQSATIARFAARLAGLAGKTSIEQAVADQVADCFLHDLLDKFIAFTFEKDETKKEQIKTTYTTEIIPFYLGKLEKILQENGGQYFAGSLTYADIAFYRFISVGISSLDLKPQPEKYPLLTGLYSRVKEIPGIKDWESRKPNTPF